jgi:hypothetical protein
MSLRIIKIANTKFVNAKLFQSQIDRDGFKLNMIPIIRSKIST